MDIKYKKSGKAIELVDLMSLGDLYLKVSYCPPSIYSEYFSEGIELKVASPSILVAACDDYSAKLSKGSIKQYYSLGFFSIDMPDGSNKAMFLCGGSIFCLNSNSTSWRQVYKQLPQFEIDHIEIDDGCLIVYSSNIYAGKAGLGCLNEVRVTL